MEPVRQLTNMFVGPWLTSWFDASTECDCWPHSLDEDNDSDDQQESAGILTVLLMSLGMAGLFICVNLFTSAGKSDGINSNSKPSLRPSRLNPTAPIMIEEQDKRAMCSMAELLCQMQAGQNTEWKYIKHRRRPTQLKQIITTNTGDNWKDALTTTDDEMENPLPVWHDLGATTDDEIEPLSPIIVPSSHHRRNDDTIHDTSERSFLTTIPTT